MSKLVSIFALFSLPYPHLRISTPPLPSLACKTPLIQQYVPLQKKPGFLLLCKEFNPSPPSLFISFLLLFLYLSFFSVSALYGVSMCSALFYFLPFLCCSIQFVILSFIQFYLCILHFIFLNFFTS